MTNVRSLANLASVYPLTFENTELQVLDLDGHIWLTAADLSRGLGYARADEVARIYRRNKDEFSEDMTALIGLQTNESAEAANLAFSDNLQTQTRIFSARGCHLVAMLARTEKAKAFRKWVLDVLGSLDKKDPPQKKRSHFTEFGKADLLERMLDKATDMAISEAADINQQRIDKMVQERAEELVKVQGRGYFGGARLLIEPNGTGGFNTRILKNSETVLCDSKLAEYIADWRGGPATYFLPAIMQAAAKRMQEMCELPFVERDHEE